MCVHNAGRQRPGPAIPSSMQHTLHELSAHHMAAWLGCSQVIILSARRLQKDHHRPHLNPCGDILRIAVLLLGALSITEPLPSRAQQKVDSGSNAVRIAERVVWIELQLALGISGEEGLRTSAVQQAQPLLGGNEQWEDTERWHMFR